MIENEPTQHPTLDELIRKLEVMLSEHKGTAERSDEGKEEELKDGWKGSN